jgi:beta-glucanase (GH16 family)
MTAGFHTYGLLWTEEDLIWWFDRRDVWRQPTPPEAQSPMFRPGHAYAGVWMADHSSSKPFQAKRPNRPRRCMTPKGQPARTDGWRKYVSEKT